MIKNFSENTLSEQPVIDWLKEIGYEYAFGPDIGVGGPFMERTDYKSVVLEARLKRSLRRINPDIPEEILNNVTQEIIRYSHPDLELGNKEMYEKLIRGIVVEVSDEKGERRGKVIKIFDFEKPDNNEFLVVNQFAVEGNTLRVPDVVVFINGIPVGVFELKSPVRENATIVDAFSQIHDIYKRDIPKIFYYNQILAVSDLHKARHGTISAGWDFFSPWKGIDSENEEHSDKTELEVLVKGLFPPLRLLDIIRNFTVYEADAVKDATKFTKKMCMYHQYFGVNRAIERTLKAVKGNKKIGVFWHTQGSGKTLSMVFYTNKVSKLEELGGPTLLYLTDRNDLDQQMYKTFLRSGYPMAKQAENIKGLIDKLKGAGAELLFTTIQKFEMDEVLSNRENIIVISDEAHRSQYAKLAGNVRDVIPNASFMGITGTPIAMSNRNTQIVFGTNISEYTIDRSEKDGTTVKIYYEGRLTPLHIKNDLMEEDFDDLVGEKPIEVKEAFKKKFAKLEQAVGADDRLEEISKDIVYHFNNRGVLGKGMIVTMSRSIAVKMYGLINKLENAPEIAVVISSNQEYKDKIQNELDNKELEKRFKNPSDHLKLVIVCDMWLTGFDVPSLFTMYLDKPIRGHTLMQAIARVNRRYKDKEGGLIVDYIGVADNLKKALSIYTSDIQRQALIPIEQLIQRMNEVYGEVKEFFIGVNYKDWKKLKGAELVELFSEGINAVLTNPIHKETDKDRKKNFLNLQLQLYKLFSLIVPHKEANLIRSDVEFFEGVRRGIIKSTMVDPVYIDKKTESAIKDLISEGIASEGVIDIFAQRGKQKPDISILDEKFLDDIKKSRMKNLTIETINKLMNDELRSKMRTNFLKYKSLLEILEKIIEDYENNIINSSKVIEKLLDLAKEIKQSEKEGKDLGLTEEEKAFYDALSNGKKALRDKEMKGLVREIVSAIKRDIAIDWTNHEIIKSRVRADVRIVLLKHNIDYEEVNKWVERVFEQASCLYKNFPQVV